MVQAIKKEWQEESMCLLTGINAFRKGSGGTVHGIQYLTVGRSVDQAEEQTGTETDEDGLQNDSLYQESVI